MKNKNFDINKYLIKSSLGFLSIIVFILGNLFLSLPLAFLDIESRLLMSIILIISTAILLFVLALIFKDVLYRDLIDFLKNKDLYFKKYFKFWFVILAGMFLSNIIAMQFTEGVAQNQEAVLNFLREMPLYMYFSAVIFAPIAEELVFRQGFRQIILNDKLFILLSGLSFGVIHIIAAEEIISQLPFLPAYTIPGFVFAYLLVKTKNIFVPIGIHFVHNGVLISIQIIAMIFGGI